LDIGLTIGGAGVPIRSQEIRGETVFGTEDDVTPPRVYIEQFLSAEIGAHLSYASGRERLLDIGCGDGDEMNRLREGFGFRQGWGLDIAPRQEWELCEGCHYVVADAERLPFRSDCGGFDMVVSVHALEHIRGDLRVLRQIPALLSPEGIGVFIVPSPAAFLVYGFHGFRGYSPRTFAKLCDAAGLSLKAVYRQGGVPSFLLHFFAITLPEIYFPLFRLPAMPKVRGRKGFRRFLIAMAKLDPLLPLLSSSYVFIVGRAVRESRQRNDEFALAEEARAKR
jgi:SAM-dependent methyltransferase